MKVTIYADDRAMALMALELADKECDRVRNALDRLQLEDLTVKAFQGVLDSLRVSLKDVNNVEHELDFTHRRALGIALLFYKATINKRRGGDEKLLIDPKEILRKLGDVSALLERLSGQETLFSASISWTEAKPAKVRKGHGAEEEDDDAGDLWDSSDDADDDDGEVYALDDDEPLKAPEGPTGVHELTDAHV
jgi:hypothetical protein